MHVVSTNLPELFTEKSRACLAKLRVVTRKPRKKQQQVLIHVLNGEDSSYIREIARQRKEATFYISNPIGTQPQTLERTREGPYPNCAEASRIDSRAYQ